jgi:hypothetical protein
VFYNNSAFDGNNAAAGAGDDGAVATDKRALLPGQAATFANYTSYSKGINGLMVDITNLPAGAALTAADFSFLVGNGDPGGGPWSAPAAQPAVSVRRGAGAGGSDRVTLVWPDGAVKKTWLQVTVKANANTGLPSPDVFYFGSAPGESGNFATAALVNFTDELAARHRPRGASNPAPVTFNWDYNRDRRVDSRDWMIARANRTTAQTALKLIAAPAGAAAAAGTATAPRAVPAAAPASPFATRPIASPGHGVAAGLEDLQ